MFESIILRPNENRNHPFDCGQMIENLFFYDKTIVHIGRGHLNKLYELADIHVLEELLSNPALKLFYNNSHTGMMSAENSDIIKVDSFSISDLDIERQLFEETFEKHKDEFRSKKFSKKIAKYIHEYLLPKNFNDVLITQLKDEEFLKQVVNETIKTYDPDLLVGNKNIEYGLEFINNDSFRIRSNIDFSGNEKVHENSAILSLINGIEDLYVMGQENSEISIPEFNSKIVRLKTKSILDQTKRSNREIEMFTHYVYDESWALREAINSKTIHVKAALNVLKKAEKFKSWLKELDNDSNLMDEYVKKVEEKSIFESFPLRAIKFYLFNGLSMIVNAANPEAAVPIGLGINFIDSFLLDLLNRKWKPNQFVYKELRPLVKNEE